MAVSAVSLAPPASPCVGICRIHPQHGWCEGCWRSLAEIADWSRSSDDTKRLVLAALPAREADCGGIAADEPGASE
jgi:predicted Fe-S protein YdhL (DUF1289 family)